jgi:tetratricopeptide (TPR) repeat protein
MLQPFRPAVARSERSYPWIAVASAINLSALTNLYTEQMSPIRVVMRDLEVSMGTRTHLVALGTIGILAILQSNIASAARGCDGPNPDILIADCTDIIQSGSAAPYSLAVAYTNRGVAYAMRRQYDRALEDYGQAIKYDPSFAIAYNNRCYALAQLAKLEEALADCGKALTLTPRDPNFLDSRAYVYLRMGKYAEAIKDYDEALYLSPQLVLSLYGRGVAKFKVGDAAAAGKDLAAAKAIDPDIAKKMVGTGLVIDGTERLSNAAPPRAR